VSVQQTKSEKKHNPAKWEESVSIATRCIRLNIHAVNEAHKIGTLPRDSRLVVETVICGSSRELCV
jgi:hypothetical protein